MHGANITACAGLSTFQVSAGTTNGATKQAVGMFQLGFKRTWLRAPVSETKDAL